MSSPPAGPIDKIVYFGSPAMAVPPLMAIIDAGIEVVMVVTNTDARRGRGNELAPTPVKRAALGHQIPVVHDPALAADAGADLGVVVAYGHLLKPDLLARLPMVNLHFSLLPAWRGAAPLERAFLAGDTETGVCVIEVADELDAGGIFAERRIAIGADDTMEGLRERLVTEGTDLLVTTLLAGLGEATPQQGEITWAKKVSPRDFAIDWESPADQIVRLVRSGQAHTTWRGRRFRIHEVAAGRTEGVPLKPGEIRGVAVGTGSDPIELMRVQAEGKPIVEAGAWANGARLTWGERFGG